MLDSNRLVENMMYIFLDIDGVFLPDSYDGEEIGEENDLPVYALIESCVTPFVEVIENYDADIKLVIISSWKDLYSLDTIKSVFPEVIAKRIVGVTRDQRYRSGSYSRHDQVLAYLKEYATIQTPWLAIDDGALLYAPNAPLIATDTDIGFTEEHAKILRQMIDTALSQK